MLKAIEKDLNDRFADVREDMVLGMAYTCSKEEAQEWKQEIAEKFSGIRNCRRSAFSERCLSHRTRGYGSDLYEKVR